MKEHPILFSGAMVRAILDGRKTQTRRVLNFDRNPNIYGGASGNAYSFDGYDTVTDTSIVRVPWTKERIEALLLCPYGKPGDRLWVRETFLPVVDGEPTGWYEYEGTGPDEMGYGGPDEILYRATDDHHPTRWRPSIFMPRWASRIALEIVKVRVDRVQDISEQDAIAEGIGGDGTMYQNYFKPNMLPNQTARSSYYSLWDAINARRGYSWESNPWVWCVEFKVISGRDLKGRDPVGNQPRAILRSVKGPTEPQGETK